MTSWIKTDGGQLSSPLTFSNIIMAILWGNTLITFENDIIDKNGETTEEFILKKNIIRYLNLVLFKKLFQRIG